MPTLTVLLLWAIVGACLHGAINHLASWNLRRENRISAYFGLMCLLGALYAFVTSLSLYVTDLEAYRRFDLLRSSTLAPLIAFIPLFLAYYADQRPGRLEKAYAALLLLHHLIKSFVPGAGFLSSITGFSIREHPFGGPLPSANGPLGWGGYGMYLLYLLLFLFTLRAIAGLRQRKQNRKTLWLSGVLFFTILAYCYDLWADLQGLPRGDIGEYAVFLFLLAVGVDLGVRRVKAERDYRTLFHSIHDGISIHDAQSGQVLDINEALARMFQTTRDRLLATDLKEITQTSDSFTAEALIERIRRTDQEGPSLFEWRARRSDGTFFWAEASCQGALIDGRRVVLATIRDIEKRIEAQEHQRRSDDLNRAIIEGFDGYIFICSQTGILEFANQALSARLAGDPIGASCQEVLSRLIGPAPWCKDPSTFSQGGSHHEVQGPDGCWYDVVRANLDRSGGTSSTLILIRDITQRKADEREKAALLARIHQGEKLESLGVLAGGAAHDFNNLLTAILGNADLAGEQIPAGSPGKASIEKLKQAARKAADLTKQLLAYSGQGRFRVGPVSVNHVIREVVDVLRVSLPHVHHLEFHLDPTNPQVLADSIQFKQVVMNLLTNAGEATEGTHGSITFTTGVSRPPTNSHCEPADATLPAGPLVFLEVKDEGRGMSDETRRRMFEPFFSTKFTGRGLGMAAVLGIVRSHSGGIQVESSAGRGTAIRVWLPAAPGTQEGGEPPLPVSFSDIRQALVVDDEPMVCDAVAASLHSLGWEVTTANDGMTALELLRTAPRPPDLVLMDMAMPRLDGRQTAQLMRESYPNLRILMMSGAYARPQDDPLGFSDMDGFLLKPFSIPELKERLKGLFEPKP